ncbi:MAG: malate dehydrogenase [Candidatus Schekmanbacteria bacterium]|nr:malate dehydrogenase [Candidatus Schekmanbacteria bacterium]
MRKKVSIIGAGQVGTIAALQTLAAKLADVVLIDLMDGLAKGKTLDLQQAAALMQSDCAITGGNDYDLTTGSDVVVITAGIPRQPGMSRADLLATNARIVKSVMAEIITRSPEAILLMVTNPLDAICAIAQKASGFPAQRVIGMGGVLDGARMQSFIAQELGVSVKDVQACVIGVHGEQMLPLPRFSTVAGVPLTELLSPDKIQRIVERTVNGGAEIVAHLKTGSAFLAPGTSVAEMLKGILLDEKRIMPAAVCLQGEYGLRDIYLGVPVRIGSQGIEEIIQLRLDADELAQLQAGAQAISQMLAQFAME